MAMHQGLDFAIAYVCALGLFCLLAFYSVPVITRAAYVAVRNWLTPRPEHDHMPERHGSALLGDGYWWE